MFYCDNVDLCVNINAKTYIFKHMLTQWSTQKWHITLFLTTLDNVAFEFVAKILQVFAHYGDLIWTSQR
jgi:hypothetical protein